VYGPGTWITLQTGNMGDRLIYANISDHLLESHVLEPD